MNLIVLTRTVTLTAYFALLVLLILWFSWLAPSARFPVALVLLVMVTPLLFPLRGLLYGKPYTHAWTSFLILLYFVHGVVETYSNADERLYAALEVLFSVLIYVGAVSYARLKGQELKSKQAEVI